MSNRSLAQLHKAAEQGDVLAQVALGHRYAEGRGVPQDTVEAFRWFLQAARRGNPIAQHNTGWYYENGMGVEQSYAEAAGWYRRAAEQGLWTSKGHANGLTRVAISPSSSRLAAAAGTLL